MRLSELEHGKGARLPRHHMLGLAVGEIKTTPARKVVKFVDRVARIEQLLEKQGSMNLRDIAYIFRRSKAVVYKWACDGVAQGRLLIVDGRSNNPRYRLPGGYVSQESAAEDKLQCYRGLIAAHPEGVTGRQVAEILGVTTRTANRWLRTGVCRGMWVIVGYRGSRQAYIFGLPGE